MRCGEGGAQARQVVALSTRGWLDGVDGEFGGPPREAHGGKGIAGVGESGKEEEQQKGRKKGRASTTVNLYSCGRCPAAFMIQLYPLLKTK